MGEDAQRVQVAHVVVITDRHPLLNGQFLKGPRTPLQVKRNGYGFTKDQEKAWRFPNEKAAANKARIVNFHMGWLPGVLKAEYAPRRIATQDPNCFWEESKYPHGKLPQILRNQLLPDVIWLRVHKVWRGGFIFEVTGWAKEPPKPLTSHAD